MARTKRSIKTVSALNTRGYRCSLSQKEPSAKRCINTCLLRSPRAREAPAGNHRAPKGASRRTPCTCPHFNGSSEAPSIIRRITTVARIGYTEVVPASQKAPSAKRCIKTLGRYHSLNPTCHVQKAPSAIRCIKTISQLRPLSVTVHCQKAPSTPNFACNSLLSTLYQQSEIAELQRSDFKRCNNRPGITCNIFTEPSVARTKRCIKTPHPSSAIYV